jgi:hypothetical protein
MQVRFREAGPAQSCSHLLGGRSAAPDGQRRVRLHQLSVEIAERKLIRPWAVCTRGPRDCHHQDKTRCGLRSGHAFPLDRNVMASQLAGSASERAPTSTPRCRTKPPKACFAPIRFKARIAQKMKQSRPTAAGQPAQEFGLTLVALSSRVRGLFPRGERATSTEGRTEPCRADDIRLR